YHLEWWLKSVKTAQLTEFRNFSTSFVSWKGQIINAFLLPFSNGYTEGCNNKIKVLKRISYGLRHFGCFRTRILLLSKKNGTEHKGVRCQKSLLIS
ncbi:MAG: transposase, partial [Megasphaera micronuciformis]|nr:transposase [Megasphaera micronuciformis]